MATDDPERSGPVSGQADEGAGSAAGQGGAGADDKGPPGEGSKDEERPGGEPAGPDAEADPLKDALGHGGLGGRRAREDKAEQLFHTNVKDEDLPAVYVKPDEYGRALQALEGGRVVVLQGKPGSGRHAMARHLLLDGLKLKQVDELDPSTELGKLKPRHKGHGHVLERCPPDRASQLLPHHLRTDRSSLEEWQSYLVVTVDDNVEMFSGEQDVPLVACVSVPDLKLVLERHLDLYLRGQGGLRKEDRDWLASDKARRYLERQGELRRTVRLARQLESRLAAAPTSDRFQHLDSLLDTVESPEERARGQLERSQDVEHWSFVIALAVYEGGNRDVVADAAGLLAQRLAPGDPRSGTAWQPGPERAERLQQTGAERSDVVPDAAGLLALRLAPGDPRSPTAWRPGPARSERLNDAGAEPFDAQEQAVMFHRSPARRVRFKDPTLRSAILDHVWNECDELRGPVRDWLDALGGDLNSEVREPAAEVVGYLATHSFGYVLDLVIFPWAIRNRTTREAAAVALGAVARDDRFTRPVLTQLSHWARWGDRSMREAAAMAYGRTIGQRRPDVALRELRALAMREEAQRPVADALFELVRRWRHREVLDALCEWTERPERATWSPAERHLVQTGLTAFLLSTRVYGESGLSPVLLGAAEEDPNAREQVVILWRRALADDLLGERAGEMLCGWAREADFQASRNGDGQPALVPALSGLLAEVCAAGPAHAGRVRHALNRCAHAHDDPSATARKLVEQLG